MKTRLFAVLMLVMNFSVSLVWADKVESDTPLPIEIVKKDFTPNQPRHIIFSPIECYYYSGILYFTFNEDLGDVEISVSSGTKTWGKIIETFDGMGEISISNGAPGSYTVEIVTEYDECFYGEFFMQ